MSAVKDLSKLPIGTKVEMIINRGVVYVLHAVSLYINQLGGFRYELRNEKD